MSRPRAPRPRAGAYSVKLGGLPDGKIALLKKMAHCVFTPRHWRARLIIGGAFVREVDGTQSDYTKAGIALHKNGMTRSHSGDLRTVTLEVSSQDERDQRAAKYAFGKMFERLVRLPCPDPITPPRVRRPSDDPEYRRGKGH